MSTSFPGCLKEWFAFALVEEAGSVIVSETVLAMPRWLTKTKQVFNAVTVCLGVMVERMRKVLAIPRSW